jgi:hypothetical protein
MESPTPTQVPFAIVVKEPKEEELIHAIEISVEEEVGDLSISTVHEDHVKRIVCFCQEVMRRERNEFLVPAVGCLCMIVFFGVLALCLLV